MKKSLEIETKVGVFVTVGTGLVMLAILLLGGAESLFTRHNQYRTHFQSVEGLISGAKVVLSGLRIGTVKSVELDPGTRDIQVLLEVEKKYENWIREDTSAEILTQGVLGDKYISLNTGSESAPLLPAGGKISSAPTKDLAQFLSKGDQLMVSLNSIASTLDRLLKNFEQGNRSDIFFEGLANTAKNLSQATDKINQELDQVRLKSAIGHLDSILEKVNNGTGTLGALVNDPGLYYDARMLLGGANRNRIIRNLVRKTVKDGDEAAASKTESQ